MNFLTVVSLLSSLALVASSPLGNDHPDPKTVYVESLTYGGSGCPQGSVSKSISDDKTVFTLIFDQYIVSTGPNVPITESRKDCQINLNVHYPGGFTYGIANIDYRGFAQLPAGVSGVTTSTYYFSGETAQCRSEHTLQGPCAKDYNVRDSIPVASMVFCPCGKVSPVNIKNAIYISGPRNVPAQLTTDSIDGSFQQVFTMQWQRC